MNLFIDTEFNGFKGELISIALVDEDGREFYESLGCESPVSWVAEHVMPVILIEPRPLFDVQCDLQEFLKIYDTIHIVADWPDDIAYFCKLLITDDRGNRIDTPRLTMEIRRDLDGAVSALPHNALEDAKGIRRYVMGLSE